MTAIQQISIFLENKSGSLYRVMEVLAKADIRIIAATVADTSEYGILRLITTDNQAALTLLKSHSISANVGSVIAFGVDSAAGSFFEKLKQLAIVGIVKVRDIDAALQVVENNNFDTFTVKEMSEM